MPVFQLPPTRKLRPKRRVQSTPGSTHNHPLYKSHRWRVLRAHLLAVRGWRCEGKDHDPRYPRQQSAGAYLELDHVKPYGSNPELAFDVSNLQFLCRRCHGAKTVEGQKERQRQTYWLRLMRRDGTITDEEYARRFAELWPPGEGG